MSRSDWGAIVAMAFALLSWIVPFPETYRPAVGAVVLTVLVFALGGWFLSHLPFATRLKFHPMTLFIVGAAGFLVAVAAYLSLLPKAETTRDERPAVSSGLVGSIEQVKVSEVTDPAGLKIPLIALVMSLRNTGAPTAAEGFDLEIVGEDGSTVSTEHIAMPTQMTLLSPEGDEVIYGSDALESKTLQPIPTGAVVRGRLLYFIRTRAKQEIEVAFSFGAKLVVKLVDGFGKPASVTSSNLSQGASTLRFPGLTYPPPPPPPIAKSDSPTAAGKNVNAILGVLSQNLLKAEDLERRCIASRGSSEIANEATQWYNEVAVYLVENLGPDYQARFKSATASGVQVNYPAFGEPAALLGRIRGRKQFLQEALKEIRANAGR